MAERDFRLPDLGEGLEDAEVVNWLVSVGDEVVLNQPLVEVDTAKALVEIPSPFAGKIVKLHASAGDVVKVGVALVTFEIVDQAATEQSKRTALLVGYGVDEKAKPKRRRRLQASVTRGARVPPPEYATGRVQAAPPVRKLANELGVDLGSVRGTGPAGRVTREDVLAASTTESRSGQAADEERIPVRGVRRVVAQKMARSAQEIPHVTTFLTVDASELLRIREEAQKTAPETKVTALAIVGKVFVEICKMHPKLNASWDGGQNEIVLKRYYHLGIATDTERGLIVPVVKNADSLDFAGLAVEINRLAEAARNGSASPEDLTGSTVTISNVGSFGAEFGTPIVNYPESSILALGLIETKPAAHKDAVVLRPSTVLSLSFDHRILDGAEAGRALLDLKRVLEDFDRLSSL